MSRTNTTRGLWLSPPILALTGIIAVLVVVIVTLLVTGGRGAGEAETPAAAQTEPQTEPPLPDLARRVADDPTAMGEVDAPVVIIEWADYRCPFCGIFARETQPTLVEEYVETGLVRIEWRDLPVFGDESMLAAYAGRAAGEQGLFWEFHDVVFADAPERGHASLPRERLIQIAQDIGVPDLAKFEADMDDPALRALVQQDQEEGYSLGVTGTPTFLVGQTPMVGAQPVEAFRAAIQAELDRLGQ